MTFIKVLSFPAAATSQQTSWESLRAGRAVSSNHSLELLSERDGLSRSDRTELRIGQTDALNNETLQ